LGQIVGDAWFQDDDGQTRSHAFLYTPGVGFIALGSLLDYPGVTPRRSTSAARSWVLP
jgi:probable HAF family extracellular repeat protein